MANTLNILILGETGVGKSTWVNGFCNYFAHNTFEEAEASESLSILIPTQFTVTDENFDQVHVSLGESAEENQAVGQSATQKAKIYKFETTKNIINFIDTPGIGDSRGVIQDSSNMENIMQTIHSLGKVHGICILLKPNEARLTLAFRFCIQELLGHLHKEAISNIVFGFTNTRGNSYRPGESITVLRELIAKELPWHSAQGIKLNNKTIFCFDSEAFRYLAAFKKGVTFPPEEREIFIHSWNQSNKEARRMIEQIESLSPHMVSKTINLFKVRKTIDAITKPVVDISLSIEVKIAEIEEAKKKIMENKEAQKNLGNNLFAPIEKVVNVYLPYLRVVCSHESCIENVMHRGIRQIHYKMACHDECKCWNWNITPALDTKGEAQLLKCNILANGVCHNSQCGHPWQYHMYVNYYTQRETISTLDVEVGGEMLINLGKIMWKNLGVSDLEKKTKSLKDEKAKMQKVAARLSAVLKTNAIDDENDAMAEYIDHLIKEARERKNGVEDLEELKKSYNVKLGMIRQDSAGNGDLTSSEVDKLVDELVELKEYGDEILTSLNKLSKSYGGRIRSKTMDQKKAKGEKCIVT